MFNTMPPPPGGGAMGSAYAPLFPTNGAMGTMMMPPSGAMGSMMPASSMQTSRGHGDVFPVPAGSMSTIPLSSSMGSQRSPMDTSNPASRSLSANLETTPFLSASQGRVDGYDNTAAYDGGAAGTYAPFQAPAGYSNEINPALKGNKVKASVQSDFYSRWAKDHRSIVGLACGGFLVGILSSYLFYVSLHACNAWSLVAFSQLTWWNGMSSSSFWTILVVFQILAMFALILSCRACGVAASPEPQKSSLQLVAGIAAVICLALWLPAFIGWIISGPAKLEADRAANIICQDRIWVEQQLCSSGGRRLSAGGGMSMSAAEALFDYMDNSGEGCEQLQDLCPVSHVLPDNACVCSGVGIGADGQPVSPMPPNEFTISGALNLSVGEPDVFESSQQTTDALEMLVRIMAQDESLLVIASVDKLSFRRLMFLEESVEADRRRLDRVVMTRYAATFPYGVEQELVEEKTEQMVKISQNQTMVQFCVDEAFKAVLDPANYSAMHPEAVSITEPVLTAKFNPGFTGTTSTTAVYWSTTTNTTSTTTTGLVPAVEESTTTTPLAPTVPTAFPMPVPAETPTLAPAASPAPTPVGAAPVPAPVPTLAPAATPTPTQPGAVPVPAPSPTLAPAATPAPTPEGAVPVPAPSPTLAPAATPAPTALGEVPVPAPAASPTPTVATPPPTIPSLAPTPAASPASPPPTAVSPAPPGTFAPTIAVVPAPTGEPKVATPAPTIANGIPTAAPATSPSPTLAATPPPTIPVAPTPTRPPTNPGATPGPTLHIPAPTPAPTVAVGTRLLFEGGDVDFGLVYEHGNAEPRILFAAPSHARGAYCGNWDSEDQHDWCYVKQAVTCGTQPDPPDAASAPPANMVASTGPCTDAVEARSGLLGTGEDLFMYCARVAVALGVALLTVAACSIWVFTEPPTFTPEKLPVSTFAGAEASDLHQRFQMAQEQVMRNTKNSTPEAQKLLIYGLYKQAIQGDAKGDFVTMGPQEQQKFNAWAQHRGMPVDTAKERYIQEAARL